MKRGIVFFWIFILLSGVCFAQTSNNETRIYGTWTTHENETWVFNSNGTLTIEGGSNKYGVTDSKLAILYGNEFLIVFNYSLSSNGRILILESTLSEGISTVKFDFWLTKK